MGGERVTQNRIDGSRQIKDYSITSIKMAVGALLEDSRVQAVFTSTTLNPQAEQQSTLILGTGFRLLKIEVSGPARVRLYATVAHQTADAARILGATPRKDHGLIFEFVSSSTCLAAATSPVVHGYSMETLTDVDCPISVQNLDTIAATVVVTLTNIITEV